ncbi:MAG TPA: hypothetical protein VGP99_08520 [Tepidisphaeraceae bacterium]|jgi:hypothetical protein|nr:hypothetical protein [Tepidisphaeraceae bacterium]
MRRGILVLSGLFVVLSAAALVRWAAGYPAILPWPVLIVVLAMAGGGFVIAMLRDQEEETPTLPTPRRISKKHRPRGRAKKRIIRNAFKRRRARKAGAIFLSHETEIAHPGGQQVGFFG